MTVDLRREVTNAIITDLVSINERLRELDDYLSKSPRSIVAPLAAIDAIHRTIGTKLKALQR